MEKDKAPAKATFSAAGIAAVVMLAGWCGPALGSIDIPCDAAQPTPGDTAVTAAPTLAAHTEAAIAEIPDDDAVKLPALSEAVTKSKIESVEESATADDEVIPGSDTTAIITRLPGVSDSVLPSFRRQMYRTDI